MIGYFIDLWLGTTPVESQEPTSTPQEEVVEEVELTEEEIVASAVKVVDEAISKINKNKEDAFNSIGSKKPVAISKDNKILESIINDMPIITSDVAETLSYPTMNYSSPYNVAGEVSIKDFLAATNEKVLGDLLTMNGNNLSDRAMKTVNGLINDVGVEAYFNGFTHRFIVDSSGTGRKYFNTSSGTGPVAMAPKEVLINVDNANKRDCVSHSGMETLFAKVCNYSVVKGTRGQDGKKVSPFRQTVATPIDDGLYTIEIKEMAEFFRPSLSTNLRTSLLNTHFDTSRPVTYSNKLQFYIHTLVSGLEDIDSLDGAYFVENGLKKFVYPQAPINLDYIPHHEVSAVMSRYNAEETIRERNASYWVTKCKEDTQAELVARGVMEEDEPLIHLMVHIGFTPLSHLAKAPSAHTSTSIVQIGEPHAMPLNGRILEPNLQFLTPNRLVVYSDSNEPYYYKCINGYEDAEVLPSNDVHAMYKYRDDGIEKTLRIDKSDFLAYGIVTYNDKMSDFDEREYSIKHRDLLLKGKKLDYDHIKLDSDSLKDDMDMQIAVLKLLDAREKRTSDALKWEKKYIDLKDKQDEAGASKLIETAKKLLSEILKAY